MSEPAPDLQPVHLPPLAATLDRLWNVILDLADRLDPTGWALVGGQMVMLHGVAAGRAVTRASHDVDVLADLLTQRAGRAKCVQAVRQLELEPEPDSRGKVYRFRRATDDTALGSGTRRGQPSRSGPGQPASPPWAARCPDPARRAW